jgi:alkylation response protein AidB-like acyl-CoA dehydrogenase
MSSAAADCDRVILNARKSWVTSAGQADSLVWSSRPVSGDGPMSLWFVSADTPGAVGRRQLRRSRFARQQLVPDVGGGCAGAVVVVARHRRWRPGLGALAVLPVFLLLNASASVGLMEAVTAETVAHIGRTRLEHLGRSLAEHSEPRAAVARMRIDTDRTAALVDAALTAIEQGRPEGQLLVLEVKAAADESAAATADLAMLTCGGAAFRKELGIERRFRDSRVARVMAPTTAALHDFVGRALTGLPLLDGPAE